LLYLHDLDHAHHFCGRGFWCKPKEVVHLNGTTMARRSAWSTSVRKHM
jgi:hypothetical protein